MRDLIQQQAYNAWAANPRSVLELATGVGKTRIAIMAVEAVVNKFPEAKILIITPTEVIRDKVFPEDFAKFGKSDLLKNCTIECIQTVYRWENQDFTLVVADELHRYLPKEGDYEYFKFFEKNRYRYFLGLSATIEHSLKHYQLRLGPTVYSYSISQAAKDGVVSAFKIVNLAVELTKDEEDELKSVQRNYNYYEHLLGGMFSAFDNAKAYLANGTPEQKIWANIFYRSIKRRKSIVDKAINKKLIARKIMDAFPNSVGILFSADIEQCEDVVSGRENSIVYHSKLGKKAKASAISKLETGQVKYISTVKALNEGLSINNLEIGIELSGNSKAKDTIQRIGRICRYVEDKQPVFIRLYIKNTQDEKWMRNSQRDLDQSMIYWANSIEELLTLIN